jgi:hypothetical protein
LTTVKIEQERRAYPPEMMDEPDIDDCFGRRAAQDLLKAGRAVLDEQDLANPGTIQMAMGALEAAQKWLRRCADCRVGRQAGREPLCGPLPAEV